MQVVPWIVLPVFLKQCSAFIQEHDSLPSKIWQLSSSYPPSCSPYLAFFFATFYSIICLSSSRPYNFVSSKFIKPSLSLMSVLVLSTLHTNYILSSIWWSNFLDISQLFNDMDAFIQVSLATIFMRLVPYFVGIQLASSCASQISCSFHWGDL